VSGEQGVPIDWTKRYNETPKVEEIPMRSYFKELTVEEEAGGNIIKRKVKLVVHPILSWFDGLGIYHELVLFGSDLDWLSEMHVSVDG
jgi:hypothetical protein